MAYSFNVCFRHTPYIDVELPDALTAAYWRLLGQYFQQYTNLSLSRYPRRSRRLVICSHNGMLRSLHGSLHVTWSMSVKLHAESSVSLCAYPRPPLCQLPGQSLGQYVCLCQCFSLSVCHSVSIFLSTSVGQLSCPPLRVTLCLPPITRYLGLSLCLSLLLCACVCGSLSGCLAGGVCQYHTLSTGLYVSVDVARYLCMYLYLPCLLLTASLSVSICSCLTCRPLPAWLPWPVSVSLCLPPSIYLCICLSLYVGLSICRPVFAGRSPCLSAAVGVAHPPVSVCRSADISAALAVGLSDCRPWFSVYIPPTCQTQKIAHTCGRKGTRKRAELLPLAQKELEEEPPPGTTRLSL